MILNLTQKPFHKFNTTQRLATHAQIVLHKPVEHEEEFYEIYDKFKAVITAVIVDSSNNADIVFNNDVCNYVDNKVKVVTLDTETDAETGVVNFIEYE